MIYSIIRGIYITKGMIHMNKKLKIGLPIAFALALGVSTVAPMIAEPIEVSAAQQYSKSISKHFGQWGLLTKKPVQTYEYKNGKFVKYKVAKRYTPVHILHDYKNGYYKVKIINKTLWMKGSDFITK